MSNTVASAACAGFSLSERRAHARNFVVVGHSTRVGASPVRASGQRSTDMQSNTDAGVGPHILVRGILSGFFCRGP
jgi:hypothetical protein